MRLEVLIAGVAAHATAFEGDGQAHLVVSALQPLPSILELPPRALA
ncbi:hypothetical protein [Deinococcus hopiensis]|nr:hypothetical protein [Deinococcus hopiensis]